jgi:hypothetical protein
MELKPPKKSNTYLLVVITAAFITGWIFYYMFRPQIIEASCSEIASTSSNIFAGNNSPSSPYQFEDIKAKCLLDVYLQ